MIYHFFPTTEMTVMTLLSTYEVFLMHYVSSMRF